MGNLIFIFISLGMIILAIYFAARFIRGIYIMGRVYELAVPGSPTYINDIQAVRRVMDIGAFLWSTKWTMNQIRKEFVRHGGTLK